MTFLLVLSAQGPLTVGMYLGTAGRAMWFSESMLKNPWEEDREGRDGWIDTGERDRGQGEDICTNNIWSDSDRLWGWGRQMKLGGIGYTERRERYSATERLHHFLQIGTFCWNFISPTFGLNISVEHILANNMS